jgi:RimJ/RimL family protein N-acetyltransferase
MSGTIKLRSDVSLKPLALEHAPAMFAWVSDPEIGDNIGLRTQPTLARTQEWITRALGDDSIAPSAICVGGRHVGNVILDRIDRHLATARVSIYIGDAGARGSGVGTSALYLAVRDGFTRRGLNKIWLTVHAGNTTAIKSYERVGFQREGTLRDEFKLRGRLVSALYMGLLKRDFEQIAVAAA